MEYENPMYKISSTIYNKKLHENILTIKCIKKLSSYKT